MCLLFFCFFLLFCKVCSEGCETRLLGPLYPWQLLRSESAQATDNFMSSFYIVTYSSQVHINLNDPIPKLSCPSGTNSVSAEQLKKCLTKIWWNTDYEWYIQWINIINKYLSQPKREFIWIMPYTVIGRAKNKSELEKQRTHIIDGPRTHWRTQYTDVHYNEGTCQAVT